MSATPVKALALALSTLALAAACSVPSGTKVATPARTSSVNGRVVYARMSSPHSGPRRPNHPLDIRITLDQTTVRTGTPITGRAIVTNTTAHPFVIADCHNVWLQVGLTRGGISYEPGWLQCLTFPGTKVPVGTTTIPITIATTYNECTPHPSSATARTPVCIHDRQGVIVMPRLPPGTYSTTTEMLAPTGVPMPTPNTVQVTLTP